MPILPWLVGAVALAAVHFILMSARELRLRGERKELTERTETARAFLDAAIESLPGIFYLYEYPSLRLLRWNRNHELAFGYPEETLNGKSIHDWTKTPDKVAVIEAAERTMREGYSSVEAELVSLDGSTTPYLLTGARLETSGKSYLIGVGIDISKRREAELRLREINEALESLVTERTKRLSEANEALKLALETAEASQARVLSQEKMAALGHLVTGLAHELNNPIGAILSTVRACDGVATTIPEVLEFYRGLDKDDADTFLSMYSSCLGTEPVLGSAFRARRKRLETILSENGAGEVATCAELLAEAGYAGDEATLARIAVATRASELCRRTLELASLNRSAYVINVAGEKAARVIQALRNYSKREDKAELSYHRLQGQLDTVITLLGNDLRHGVELIKDYQPVPAVRCDPERLGQVWMNLLLNAVQAIRYRGRIVVALYSVDEGRAAEVRIEDDGPGVAPELTDKIFEPFFTTKAAGEGLGLGLDTCRRIAGELGGSIRLESAPGRTAFYVRIPVDGGNQR